MKFIFLFILNCLTTYALTLEGEGVTKIDAFKDAYFKYVVVHGEISSRYSLIDGITLRGEVYLESLKKSPQITFKSCMQKSATFFCSFDFEKRSSEDDDSKVNFSELKKCNSLSKEELEICYNLVPGEEILRGEVFVIKGFVEINIIRRGINFTLIRHQRKYSLVSIGYGRKNAIKSFENQGEIMVKKKSITDKEIFHLMYEESHYKMYVLALEEGSLDYFLRQGLYPVEVLSKGRRVIYFVKKISGNGLLD